MKVLKITYDGRILFEGEVGEMTWTDSTSGVRVEGKTRPSGGGLLDLITNASKQKTVAQVERGRDELGKESAAKLEEIS